MAALATLAWCAVLFYSRSTAVDRHVAKLEQEKSQLQQIIHRLGTERRVAELLVTEQKQVDGVQQTTVLLSEDARDGTALPPQSFTVDGDVIHLDAMVIKFDRSAVGQGDPLRGCSIALFHRLYGDRQTPDHAFLIDSPNTVPEFYRGDQQVDQFEQNLWQNFWKLAENPAYRASQGVRVANGQGVWFRALPETLYTISIEQDGGLNYSLSPLPAIFRGALQQRDRS